MENDTDVLEFDFPDYEEPYPPFPDVKAAPVDMDEAYLRNAELAKRLSSDVAEPTEKAKPVPRKKKAAKPRGRKIITAAAAYAAALIGIGAVVFITNVRKPEEIGGMNLTINTDYEEYAEFEQRLESIKAAPYSNGDGQLLYDVTIGFTIKNISEEPVIIFPKLLNAYLDNGEARAPISVKGTRVGDDGVLVAINYQKDFTVTYRLDGSEVTQLSSFGYSVSYRAIELRPNRDKIAVDDKVKEEIAAFLSGEASGGIS